MDRCWRTFRFRSSAQALYERALAIREATRGPTHPATGQTLWNLGALFAASGDRARAIALLDRAVAIARANCRPVLRSRGAVRPGARWAWPACAGSASSSTWRLTWAGVTGPSQQ